MRTNKTKYGVLAVVMMIGRIGAISAMDAVSTLGLIGMTVLFLVCSAVLLFSLMKLEVMDFQEGSFWYELNLQVNAPKQRTAVRRTYTQNTLGAKGTMLV